MQGEKKKHQFEVRKPNEGVENANWKNVELLKKIQFEDSVADEEKVVQVGSFMLIMFISK